MNTLEQLPPAWQAVIIAMLLVGGVFALVGAIGLVRTGDRICIDIPQRSINVLLSEDELARRRAEQDARGWKPAQPRPRKVSAALRAYAKLVMSADKGAVRDLSLLED